MIQYIAYLFKITWSICKIQKGPQDVPYSVGLMVGSLILHTVLSWGMLHYSVTKGNVLLETLALLAGTMLFTAIALYWRGHLPRYVQTLTSLFAVGIVFTLLILPLFLLQFLFFGGKPTTFQFILAFFYLSYIIALNVWMVIVTMHIYRQALDINWPAASLITVAYLAFLALIMPTSS